MTAITFMGIPLHTCEQGPSTPTLLHPSFAAVCPYCGERLNDDVKRGPTYGDIERDHSEAIAWWKLGRPF